VSLGRRGGLTALVLAGALVLPGAASATTRYAAPGGTADDTVCVTPEAPKCSIGAAAGGPNVVGTDEAVILPGAYSEVAGDLAGDAGTLDNTVEVRAGTVHGPGGRTKPLIVLDSTAASPNNNFFGAFSLGAGTLSDIEITTGPGSTASNGLSQTGSSTVDRVIARSAVPNAITCNQSQGVIRNSVCLSSGSGGSALGASTFIGGTFTVNVRNVTAIAEGSGSSGVFYFYATASPPTGPTITVSAKGLIAQGAAQDVRVRASATGTSVTMNLDHSDYDTAIDEDLSGGVASVTAPGTGTGNITGAPMLAADGYHQVAGSPTINAGATDGNSGTQDIDGQLRQIGLAGPDIGADEFAVAAPTSVECAPSSLPTGSPAACTATVSTVVETLTGSVSFASNAGGSFNATSCTLTGGLLSKQCDVTYTPTSVGNHQITASYSGDAAHDPSEGTTLVTAIQPVTPPTTSPVTPPKKKKCKKKKKKRATAAAKKKCKKKKRR
jgi:Big-like domain-containing protein